MTRGIHRTDTHGTIPRVAAHFGIDEDRLRKAVKAGAVKTYPPASPKGPPQVLLAEVEAWMRALGMTGFA